MVSDRLRRVPVLKEILTKG